MKLAIYSKGTTDIVNATIENGGIRCYAHQVEVTQKWMEESTASVSVQSAEPVYFESGDFLFYNGKKYTLYLAAGVTKIASRESYGGAFKYDNVPFYGVEGDLKGIRMLDFVPDDNNRHYSWLPKFSFFCATIEDFMKRVIANINRVYISADGSYLRGEKWAWIFAQGGALSAINTNVSIENESVFECLKKVNTVFRTSYTIHSDVEEIEGVDIVTHTIVIGDETAIDHSMLGYGKGEGLIDISKSLNSDDIITKLYVYGSDKNFNPSYYTGKLIKSADGSFKYVGTDGTKSDGSYGDIEQDSVDAWDLHETRRSDKENPLSIITEYIPLADRFKGENFWHPVCLNYYWNFDYSTNNKASFDIVSALYFSFDDCIGENGSVVLKDEDGIVILEDEVVGNLGTATYLAAQVKKGTFGSTEVENYDFILANDNTTRKFRPSSPDPNKDDLSSGLHYEMRDIKNAVFIAKISTHFDVVRSGNTFTVTKGETPSIVWGNGVTNIFKRDFPLTATETDVKSRIVVIPLNGNGQYDTQYLRTFDITAWNWKIRSTGFDIDKKLYSDVKSSNPKFQVFDQSRFSAYALAVNNLMLPGFPEVEDVYLQDDDAVALYGVKEGCVFFDSDDFENGLADIYPSFEGMKASDIEDAGYEISVRPGDNDYVDEILISSTDENGNPLDDGASWENGEKRQPQGSYKFRVYIKDPGFDINDYINNKDPKINMLSGRCAGREFTIDKTSINKVKLYCDDQGKNINTESGDNEFWGYTFTMDRTPVQELDNKYFPNAIDFIAGVDDGRQEIRGGESEAQLHSDQFVITDILMPDVYVAAASEKLEQAGWDYLAGHNHPKFNYTPKLDNIYIQRDWDTAVDKSSALRNKLAAGHILKFSDEDLAFTSGTGEGETRLFIDTLTVKEGSTPLPEYMVSLKENKEFSAIQKVLGGLAVVGGGVGTPLDTEKRMAGVANLGYFGSGEYLSKTEDDEAEGHIRFAGGITASEATVEGGITVHGDAVVADEKSAEWWEGQKGKAHWKDENGDWHLETDFIYARKRLAADEIQIEDSRHIGGTLMLTSASAKIEKVYDRVGENWYTCIFRKVVDGNAITNDWKEGDLAFCEVYNEVGGQRRYWRRVVKAGDALYYNDIDNAEDYYFIDLSKQFKEDGIDEPMAGDNVVQMGYAGDNPDPSRTGVTIISGAGQHKGNYLVYDNVTTFSLPTPKVQISPERVYIEANDFKLVAQDGSKTDVKEVIEGIGDPFQIYQSEKNAPKDAQQQLYDNLTVAQVGALESDLNWPSSEWEEHTDDFVLWADGVCYKFDGEKWVLVNDRYLAPYVDDLANLGQIVGDVEGSVEQLTDDFATIFTQNRDKFNPAFINSSGMLTTESGVEIWANAKMELPDGTIVPVSTGLARLYVDRDYLESHFEVSADKINFEGSQMNIGVGQMTVDTPNFKLGADGVATFKGVMLKDHLVIDSSNFEKWFGDAGTLDLIGNREASAYTYIEIGNLDEIDFEGPLSVLLPTYNKYSLIDDAHTITQITPDELEGCREMVGQDIAIYNNSGKTIQMVGIFYRPMVISPQGQVIDSGGRDAEMDLHTGYMGNFLMTSRKPNIGLYEDEQGGEYLWCDTNIMPILTAQ